MSFSHLQVCKFCRFAAFHQTTWEETMRIYRELVGSESWRGRLWKEVRGPLASEVILKGSCSKTRCFASSSLKTAKPATRPTPISNRWLFNSRLAGRRARVNTPGRSPGAWRSRLTRCSQAPEQEEDLAWCQPREKKDKWHGLILDAL